MSKQIRLPVTFNIYKKDEGGMSFKEAKELLEANGVTGVERGFSPYVGQHGIRVPSKFERKAERLLYGR